MIRTSPTLPTIGCAIQIHVPTSDQAQMRSPKQPTIVRTPFRCAHMRFPHLRRLRVASSTSSLGPHNCMTLRLPYARRHTSMTPIIARVDVNGGTRLKWLPTASETPSWISKLATGYSLELPHTKDTAASLRTHASNHSATSLSDIEFELNSTSRLPHKVFV